MIIKRKQRKILKTKIIYSRKENMIQKSIWDCKNAWKDEISGRAFLILKLIIKKQ